MSLRSIRTGKRPRNFVAELPRFLFDFHRQENAKRAESVYATYLLSGSPIETKPLSVETGVQQDGEDSEMQSSPFMSSSMPQHGEEEDGPLETLVVLAREEDLECS